MDVRTLSATRLECVSLAEALFCAECEMISNSKSYCLCCGSSAVLPVARVFGGSLPQHHRTTLVNPQAPRGYAPPETGLPPRRASAGLFGKTQEAAA